jgi:DHA1 family bicyclomycin/chloramphenicol resistance-like MFS transporter
MMYLIAQASISGLFFVYVAATPFLYVETFGLSLQAYAWLFAAGAAAAGLANLSNIYLVAAIGYRAALLYQGMAAIALGALAFCAAFGLLDRWAIYLTGILLMAIMHLISTNALTGAMDQFTTRKGIASATAMSIRFGTGMLAVAVVARFQGSILTHYGLILFVFAAISGICAQMAVRWDKTG